MRRLIIAGALGLIFWLSSGVASGTPPLRAPWPCGVEYPVTQGHNTGSHVGVYNAWAWDFGIPVGGEVAAPAAGTIRAMRIDSTRGGCDSAFVADANYIVIDFGDGTEAAFTHLLANSTDLQVGDSVEAGDVVGQVGLSGWVCGAHLHFDIQKKCNGSSCETIPAEFVSFGDPASGETIISDNCGPCDAVLDGDVTLVDETSGCFQRRTSYWWSVPEGHGDHHFYTIASDAAGAETTGRWTFDVAAGGTYRVEVFVPMTEATSTSAVYSIASAGTEIPAAPVDQSLQKGWVVLGEFDFEPDQPASIMLPDNTGEPISEEKRLAYDAVRLTFVPPPAEDAGAVVDAGNADAGNADAGHRDASSPGASDMADPASGDGRRDAAAEDDRERLSAASGCGCGTPGGPSEWLLLIALLGLWRSGRWRSRPGRLQRDQSVMAP